MTRTVVALHAPDPERLYEVTWEMRSRLRTAGVDAAPLILGYDEGGEWQAICGSHRIAAAVALGVPVTLVWVDPDAPITTGALLYAIGESPNDIPTGVTPRSIIATREHYGTGVRYQVEVDTWGWKLPRRLPEVGNG
jgi:hypothetical protein